MENAKTKKEIVINNEVLDEKWLHDFYNQVGRETSLARESQRETHNWVIAIAGGVIAAAWALGTDQSFYPTEKSFILVMVIIPFIFRFFVRSCLEYQNFNRWVSLRNSLDKYYFACTIHPELSQKAMDNLINQIRLYYFQWRLPKSINKMIWDNLVLTFGWPLLIIVCLFVWGLVEQSKSLIIWVVLSMVAFWMLFELTNFIIYFAKKYTKLEEIITIREL